MSVAAAKVSELLAVKFENLCLKIQAGQHQMQQVQTAMQAVAQERAALLIDMRKEAGAGADEEYDIQTRAFRKASASLKPTSKAK